MLLLCKWLYTPRVLGIIHLPKCFWSVQPFSFKVDSESSGIRHLRYGIKYNFLYSASTLKAYLSARTWSFRSSVVSLESHPDSRCALMGFIQQASWVMGATSLALILGALITSK